MTVPPHCFVGLGCDRGTPASTLREALQAALAEAGVHPGQLAGFASATLKADEPGLVALAGEHEVPLSFYTPAQLARVEVPHPSEVVRRHTGTPSVSEAAALLAADPEAALRGTSPRATLRLEKLRWRGPTGRHATVSLAMSLRTPAVASPGRRFDDHERQALYDVLHARRDLRAFVPNQTVSADIQTRLLDAAHAAPSVGLMQPWRFIRVTDAALRHALAAEVEAERQRTAHALGARAAEFLRLKVEGVRDCALLWAVALSPDDGTVFGRRTMPRDMAVCSAAAAVQNLWLAARAENLGMGWVSIVDPASAGELLGLPAGAQLLGLLCIGLVPEFPTLPTLVTQGWRQAVDRCTVVDDNTWGAGVSTGP